MAKKNNNSSGSTNAFYGSIDQDVRHFGMSEGDYILARNAVDKSTRGDMQSRISEKSNVLCAAAPFVIIGAENIENDWWVIFSTNDTLSEIGFFRSKSCSYKKLARGTCLGFKKTHLITVVVQPVYDGSYNVYFDDTGLNVSRMFNTEKFPFIQNCVEVDGCVTCTDTDVIDCSKLRLESFIKSPCVEILKAATGGTVFNGTYTAFISYVINGQRVSDYIGKSKPLSIFSHENLNNSIELNISNLDQNFTDYELVLLTVIKEKTVARQIGFYSITQTKITLDFIDNELPTVPLNILPLVTPVPDKSEGMFKLGKYLTRINPSNKFQFNYQPLANQIRVYWQSVEYPADYYKNGGTNVGFMRDEVTALFIRWVYNTGDKTDSDHIPGRYRQPYTVTTDSGVAGITLLENDDCPFTVNDLESPQYTPKVFEVFNTAQVTATPNTLLPDGGIVVAEGIMGYHESTEFYDSNNGSVWNANIQNSPQFDLCGKPIRHHRFPDNVIVTAGGVNTLSNHYNDGGTKIRVMGIRLENVQPPRDNQGNLIEGVVGYEILRGSRNGEKTVLFKGIINNMFEYNIPNSITNRKGLYANYPFNDTRPDKFISKNADPVTYEPAQGGLVNYEPNDKVSFRNFTFHSPDTMFASPFLEADELKFYSVMYGDSRGNYLEPSQHPRHKFVTDLSFAGSVIVGFGYAIAKANGTKDVVYPAFTMNSQPPAVGIGDLGNAGSALITPVVVAGETTDNTLGLSGLIDAITGQNNGISSLVNTTKKGVITSGLAAASIPGTGVSQPSITYTYRDQNQVPGIVKAALLTLGNPMFIGYLSEGADTFLNVVRSVGAWRQYALQYQAYCKYENTLEPLPNNRRRKIKTSRYLKEGLTEFEDTHLINHKLRNETVVFSTEEDVQNISGFAQDVSRPELVSELPEDLKFNSYTRRASSHYVAFKSRKRNQYGQLSQVLQIPMNNCIIPVEQINSPVIFGGDTYIGRYSEKNTLYYFDQWLKGEPDGAIFNYFKHRMFEHVAFWMDTDPFDLMEFIQSVPDALSSAIGSGGGALATFFANLVTPSDKHCFDRYSSGTGIFLLKNVFFYLFQSGVRDFFVESEINIDYRDWEDSDDKKHWPILSDLTRMFSMDLIKADNYYKFDRSLAVSFLAQSKIGWAVLRDKNYNPLKAETVFTKRNKRLLYSLPQETGAIKDNLSVFLPLNYKDFTGEILAVKPISKTAGIIFFKNEPPKLLPGVDELQTASGAKITIGDGSLFARDPQPLDNSDLVFQNGACQSRLSIINTPLGIFYMSPEQGEIFFTNGQSIKKLSDVKLRQWLNTFLPYQLTKDYPNFELLDNPVAGIGCQASYMPDMDVVYFCKKDYRLKKNLNEVVEYVGDNNFLVGGYLKIKLGDPRFFDDASWTLSINYLKQSLISFHDWHPNLILAGPNVFHTVKSNTIWKHNSVCNSFCNFYGIDYPFEVQFLADSTFGVNTIRSIQYYLEAYEYGENCYDRYHVLNHNFDQAVIFNSEQVSGILNLIYDNGENPEISLKYPIINNNSIDILYSKEEQKYRFNQFWDIVKDRGEFTTVKELIFNTSPNGYVKALNQNNLNYLKPETERKKFRHHNNEVWLIKNKLGSIEIVMNFSMLKTLNSDR